MTFLADESWFSYSIFIKYFPTAVENIYYQTPVLFIVSIFYLLFFSWIFIDFL